MTRCKPAHRQQLNKLKKMMILERKDASELATTCNLDERYISVSWNRRIQQVFVPEAFENYLPICSDLRGQVATKKLQYSVGSRSLIPMGAIFRSLDVS